MKTTKIKYYQLIKYVFKVILFILLNLINFLFVRNNDILLIGLFPTILYSLYSEPRLLSIIFRPILFIVKTIICIVLYYVFSENSLYMDILALSFLWFYICRLRTSFQIHIINISISTSILFGLINFKYSTNPKLVFAIYLIFVLFPLLENKFDSIEHYLIYNEEKFIKSINAPNKLEANLLINNNLSLTINYDFKICRKYSSNYYAPNNLSLNLISLLLYEYTIIHYCITIQKQDNIFQHNITSAEPIDNIDEFIIKTINNSFDEPSIKNIKIVNYLNK
jgi:hypothetical protein